MNICPEISIFNRLLIRLNPEYFNLPQQEQQLFRMQLTDEHSEKAGIYLLDALFNIKTKNAEASNAAWEALSQDQKNLYNAYTTLLRGMGEDAFYLNEFFAEGCSLSDFATLYDYDLDDFKFQQQVRKAEADKEGKKPYQTKPYRLYLPHHWARLIDDGCFYYSTISSLSYYLHSRAEEYINDLIDQLIPHEYKQGSDHGKQEGKGTLWDMRIDANGLEEQLDELKHRCYQYEIDLIESLGERFHGTAPGAVYLLKHEMWGDPHLDIVVQNSEAAKRIRFQSFLRDCRALQGLNDDLESLVSEAQHAADQFVHEQYQDIVENFDPKVSRIRKRRKIVMAPGTLGDLEID